MRWSAELPPPPYPCHVDVRIVRLRAYVVRVPPGYTGERGLGLAGSDAALRLPPATLRRSARRYRRPALPCRVAAPATLNPCWALLGGVPGFWLGAALAILPKGWLGRGGAATGTRGTRRHGGRPTQDGPGCPVGRGLVASGGPPFARRDRVCVARGNSFTAAGS
jgi:hypothetical protein